MPTINPNAIYKTPMGDNHVMLQHADQSGDTKHLYLSESTLKESGVLYSLQSTDDLPETANSDEKINIKDNNADYVFITGDLFNAVSNSMYEDNEAIILKTGGAWIKAGILECVHCDDFGDIYDTINSYNVVQQALDFAGIMGIKNVKMSKDNTKTPYLNGQIQINYDNVDFDMGNVIAGKDFRFSIAGNQKERNLTSILASDTLKGTDIFELSVPANIVNFPIGSKIVVRGKRDFNTYYPIRLHKNFYVVLEHIDGNKIRVDRPVEVDFLRDFGQVGFAEKWGEPNYTRLYPVVSTTLTQSCEKDAYSATLLDASLFKKGDYVFLDDNITMDRFSAVYHSKAKIHNEPNRIVDVDYVNNIVYFEYSTSTKYDSNNTATIVKLSPVKNSKVRNGSVVWDSRTLNTTNAFEIVFGVNCHIEHCAVFGTNGFSWHRHAMRLSDCLNCSINNMNIDTALYSGGGEGYGAVCFGGKLNTIRDGIIRKTRHSILFARGASFTNVSNITSTDCYISDYDLHGTNSNRININDCSAYFGESVGGLQELIVSDISNSGANFDIQIDTDRPISVDKGNTSKVEIRGTGISIPLKVKLNDNGTVTADFASGHIFEAGDNVKIVNSEADSFNIAYSVNSTDADSITMTPTEAMPSGRGKTSWRYSTGAYVECEAKNINGAYDIVSVDDVNKIVTVDAGGATLPASLYLDNCWLSGLNRYTKSPFRVGNPTHYYGDFDIAFNKCLAFNYPVEYPICNPLPGAYGVHFDVTAINCDSIARTEENPKYVSLSQNMTTQECLVNGEVIIGFLNAQDSVSENYAIEIVSSTRPELNGIHTVSNVGLDSLTILINSVTAFSSETSDGVIDKIYPYYNLKAQNITYDLKIKRTKQEPILSTYCLDLDGGNQRVIKNIDFKNIELYNVTNGIRVVNVDGFSIRRMTANWHMPSDSLSFAGNDYITSDWTINNGQYVLYVENNTDMQLKGMDFENAQPVMRITDCPNSKLEFIGEIPSISNQGDNSGTIVFTKSTTVL